MRALHSVLGQTYAELDVVISDNASTDDTLERVAEIRDARIVLLKQQVNIGMVGNFNACLDSASGEFFLILSDDDVLEPEALEQLSRPFRQRTDGIEPDSVGVTWSPCVILDPEGRAMWTTEGGPKVEDSLSMVVGLYDGRRGPRFSSVMLRTADARSVGGYDEQRYGNICDAGNWIPVALRYDHVVCTDRALAKYTVHPLSETSKDSCRKWRSYGENLHEDLLPGVRAKWGDKGVKRFVSTCTHNIANLTTTVLMQTMGQPGWIPNAAREVWRARKYLLTPFAMGRLARDGWKLLRAK